MPRLFVHRPHGPSRTLHRSRALLLLLAIPLLTHAHTGQEEWSGRVIDINDGRPVPQVSVRLFDLELHELASATTSRTGRYVLPAVLVEAMIVVRIPGGSQALLNLPAGSVLGSELEDIRINSVMDLPVNALVKDANSDLPLLGTQVTVTDTRDGSLLFTGGTDANGIVQGQIADRRYGDDLNIQLEFEREGYFPKAVLVDWTILTFIEQELAGPEQMVLTPIELGTDMAKAMALPPIYFDLREATIRPDAAVVLDRVATMLRLDPSIHIDLRSHTDSRASSAYNDALSQRRAARTRSYLVGAGVAPERINAKGWGERQLVNHCSDGVECSDAQHQMNRRTEFIITRCEGCGARSTSNAAR
jgi:outer membrane protein OmpA-like peptidoglycan-associated protein